MQVLVDALSSRAEQAGKLVLRYIHTARPLLRSFCRNRQPDQYPRQPGLEPFEERPLDMLIGLPQSSTKQLQQRDTKICAALQKGNKIAVVDDQQIAVCNSGRIRGSLAGIEQRHL